MALTYRQTKGSALTIEELDANFQYFTGSHAVTGSLTVSGTLAVTGSIIPGDSTGTLGTADKPWKDLYLSNNSLYFISGSTSSSFSINSSGSMSGSYTGSFGGTFSGSLSGSYTGSFTGSFSSSFISSSCLIGCTSSITPSGSAAEGLFKFVTSGGNHYIYVYLGGVWRSGSLF